VPCFSQAPLAQALDGSYTIASQQYPLNLRVVLVPRSRDIGRYLEAIVAIAVAGRFKGIFRAFRHSLVVGLYGEHPTKNKASVATEIHLKLYQAIICTTQ